MKNQNDNINNDSKSMIIPIFIMNKGCPHRCIFCNQSITAGNYSSLLTKDIFDSTINTYLNSCTNKTKNIEIAFYGGNFTGLPVSSQKKFLSWANLYIKKGLVQNLRISTRPDYISDDVSKILKEQNVTTVELGAQSFVNEVLEHAQRGHDSLCIENAIKILKKYSFQTSLHLMAGLPKDTKEGFIYSLEKTVQLHPDMVRINPTLVLNNTILANQFLKGFYTPLTISEAVDLCQLAFKILSEANIRIIRFGLHITDEMKKNGAVLAGPLHPALGSLVLSSFFYHSTLNLLENIPKNVSEIRFQISPSDFSAFRGLNNANESSLQALYPNTKIIIKSSRDRRRGDIFFSYDKTNFFCLNIYTQQIYSLAGVN